MAGAGRARRVLGTSVKAVALRTGFPDLRPSRRCGRKRVFVRRKNPGAGWRSARTLQTLLRSAAIQSATSTSDSTMFQLAIDSPAIDQAT